MRAARRLLRHDGWGGILRSLVPMLRKTKTAYMVRKNPLLKTIVKSVYKFLLFPFTRRGVAVQIGGMGPYRLDYHFALSGYETFGEAHNAGFGKWIEYCRGKTVVFDVGAHIGLYTIPASKVMHSEGMVYSFEPSHANRRYLKRHLEYNGIRNVIVLPYVVGNETKEAQEFYESKNADPMNALMPKKNIRRYRKVYKAQVSLDDFAKRLNVAPQVIKIDVEGAECRVLNGAQQVIKKSRPAIFLSVHPRQLELCGSSVDELEQMVRGLHYRIQDFDGNEVFRLQRREYLLLPQVARA